MKKEFVLKDFVIVTLLTSIWIHIVEILRAVFVAFPLMKDFFGDRIEIGPMGIGNMIVWGLWDTILAAVLVFIVWLCIQSFGDRKLSFHIAGVVTSIATIGIFWIANVNTGLGTWSTAFILYPIALAEMILGAHIAQQLYRRRK